MKKKKSHKLLTIIGLMSRLKKKRKKKKKKKKKEKVLDAALLNTQHYKVSIKDKMEQSRERVAPFPTP